MKRNRVDDGGASVLADRFVWPCSGLLDVLDDSRFSPCCGLGRSDAPSPRIESDPVTDNRNNWLRIEPYRAAVMAACSPTCDKADVELQGPRFAPRQRHFPITEGRASARGSAIQAEADGTLFARRCW